MEASELYQLAMPRGAAKQVAHELGYADSTIPRRWRRPVASANNLFTGELSPLMRAKAEILAHDKVNPAAADLLIWDLLLEVARQRSSRGVEDEDAVLVALIASNHMAVEALLSGNRKEAEENLYRAGAANVRALLFVTGDEGDGLPLCRTESAVEPRRERVSLGGRLLALVKGRR